MKQKYRLVIASVLMIIAGLLRAFGGLALLLRGNQLETDVPIIATNSQTIIVAIGLLIVAILLFISAIYLMRTLTKQSWISCWIVLVIFLLDGILNGYLLFGQPLDPGQRINFIFFLITGLFLFLGRKSLKD